MPFEVLEDSIAFPIDRESPTEYPQLVVVSQPEGVKQLDFAPRVDTYLDSVDFDQRLVLLVQRGQLADSGTIQQVTREANTVTIRTRAINPGPGSYVLAGYSPPYQVITVEKPGFWGESIDFILEREGEGVISRTTVFVP